MTLTQHETQGFPFSLCSQTFSTLANLVAATVTLLTLLIAESMSFATPRLDADWSVRCAERHPLDKSPREAERASGGVSPNSYCLGCWILLSGSFIKHRIVRFSGKCRFSNAWPSCHPLLRKRTRLRVTSASIVI